RLFFQASRAGLKRVGDRDIIGDQHFECADQSQLAEAHDYPAQESPPAQNSLDDQIPERTASPADDQKRGHSDGRRYISGLEEMTERKHDAAEGIRLDPHIL